ncbi:hypothetical protein CC86DRAFT_392111 [Ophiobolus disseminans]|uniref:Uncharacterized protein n=1 Tax=Ophiobolus disseminans TaxID=1469910 RepID=A0A6A7AAF7_9PLEO|nr:hypothetical protein CC86DRAFT_392111 [Ophiobolus disseminans]
MSDAWFSSKLAPDGDTTDGCHPDEATALAAYLHKTSTASEAAQAITRPIATAEDPKFDLPRIYSLLQDAFVELPAENIELLVALLQAIEDLPALDFSAVTEKERPDDTLWKGLPGFGHQWYDVGYRSGSWKTDAKVSIAPARDALRAGHVRRAEVEARLAMAGLASIPISWGYEVVVDSLEGNDVLLDFEVLAAAEWFVICARRFRDGADMGEKTYAIKEGMSLERWEVWETRLGDLQRQAGVVGRAATRALDAMRAVDGERM